MARASSIFHTAQEYSHAGDLQFLQVQWIFGNFTRNVTIVNFSGYFDNFFDKFFNAVVDAIKFDC